MIPLRDAITILRHFGPGWALGRAGYALRQRSGLLRRRFPTPDIERLSLADVLTPGVPSTPEEYRVHRLAHPVPFFFPAGNVPARQELERLVGSAGRERTIAVADDYGRGRFLFYSRNVYDLGWPPDWLRNPSADQRHDASRHWCDTPTFTVEGGDIKNVWEPSRFAAGFWLARAYALTGAERYPQTFWTLFESWRDQNPPNRGPNWKCGQEAAVRVMAWCFALHAFWNSPATTPQRLANLVVLLALQAQRIADNISYAISQKNNHGLSEAVGLLTVGLLFPELRSAAAWRRRGQHVFETELLRQVYADGSFVQHSLNYHRVMLDLSLWAGRLLELHGSGLAAPAQDRLLRAAELLHDLHDPVAGDVPNYGANDGAQVLPLTGCDYRDYRPTIQAAGQAWSRHRPLPDGPWNELLVWLQGKAVLDEPARPRRLVSRGFDAGGYYTLRRPESWALIRCHSYRDRPSHVDPLHVDLWYRGVNVLGDSGSYAYHAPQEPDLEGYFKDISAHNCLIIDEQSPLRLLSRFLWTPWPRARCVTAAADMWSGESYAYRRAPWYVLHRRTVCALADGSWLISDEVLGRSPHYLRFCWHLADLPWTLDADTRHLTATTSTGNVFISLSGPPSLSIELVRGLHEAGRVSGWMSPYYGERQPRPTVHFHGQANLPLQVTTQVRFDARSPS